MNEQLKCGLLGEKLGHSYSPQIHAALADYEYLLYEKAPDEVESFVRGGGWNGLNVTIPYKKTVIPFCDEVSDLARDIGSVNTLLRRPDGTIFGDNTDACGFETMLGRTGFQPEGKKVMNDPSMAYFFSTQTERDALVTSTTRTLPSVRSQSCTGGLTLMTVYF